MLEEGSVCPVAVVTESMIADTFKKAVGGRKKSDKHQDDKMSVCCIIFDNGYLLSFKKILSLSF